MRLAPSRHFLKIYFLANRGEEKNIASVANKKDRETFGPHFFRCIEVERYETFDLFAECAIHNGMCFSRIEWKLDNINKRIILIA